MLQGEMGLQGQGLSGGMKGGRETEEGYKRSPEKGHWGLWRGPAGEQPFIPSFHGLRDAELGVGEVEEVDMGRRWEAEGT